eukprot:2653591-Rhodomonas_salina.2
MCKTRLNSRLNPKVLVCIAARIPLLNRSYASEYESFGRKIAARIARIAARYGAVYACGETETRVWLAAWSGNTRARSEG